MAITITTEPTADGKYSAYFPIQFQATETSNPDYLYFLVRNSSGTLIDGVSYYKSANINDVFYFDASSYIKALLNVRSEQGLSLTAIEDLTNFYGKYEVIVNTTPIVTDAEVSNEFFCFPFLDNVRFLNNETANNGINNKKLLYSLDPINSIFDIKEIGTYDRVNIFVQETYLYLDTYNIDNPTNGTLPTQTLRIDLSAYTNKIISIPLNKTFVSTNFTKVGGGFILDYKSFGLNLVNPALGEPIIKYKVNNKCNTKEFIYINRYGVKENIIFKSTDNKYIKTQSDIFKVAGYSHLGKETTFNTSADSQKINQKTEEVITIDGYKVLRKYENALIDFLTSPTVWLAAAEPQRINIFDGTYKITEQGKGMEISFKYSFAQEKKSFV